MTHGMPSKKGYVVFGVAGCVEVLRSCKDRINRRTGQDFESEMSDIEMFHAILCGGFCRCKKKLDRPCSFLVPLGFEGRHRCLVVTVPILFVERGRRHDRTRDGTRLNAERHSIVPRPAFADKYREWGGKQRERGGEEGREGWFIFSVVTQSLVMVKEKNPQFFHYSLYGNAIKSLSCFRSVRQLGKRFVIKASKSLLWLSITKWQNS